MMMNKVKPKAKNETIDEELKDSEYYYQLYFNDNDIFYKRNPNVIYKISERLFQREVFTIINNERYTLRFMTKSTTNGYERYQSTGKAIRPRISATLILTMTESNHEDITMDDNEDTARELGDIIQLLLKALFDKRLTELERHLIQRSEISIEIGNGSHEWQVYTVVGDHYDGLSASVDVRCDNCDDDDNFDIYSDNWHHGRNIEGDVSGECESEEAKEENDKEHQWEFSDWDTNNDKDMWVVINCAYCDDEASLYIQDVVEWADLSIEDCMYDYDYIIRYHYPISDQVKKLKKKWTRRYNIQQFFKDTIPQYFYDKKRARLKKQINHYKQKYLATYQPLIDTEKELDELEEDIIRLVKSRGY